MSDLVKVNFEGAEIDLLRTGPADGVAVFKRVCESVGVDSDGQVARLRRAAGAGARWATTSVMEVVAEDGKRRKMLVIPIRSLPIWAATLDPSRVDEENRSRVVAYQDKAADVLAAALGLVQPANDLAPLNDALALVVGKLEEQREGLAELRGGLSETQQTVMTVARAVGDGFAETLTLARASGDGIAAVRTSVGTVALGVHKILDGIDGVKVLAETLARLEEQSRATAERVRDMDENRGVVSREEVAEFRERGRALVKLWVETDEAVNDKSAAGHIRAKLFKAVSWGAAGEKLENLPAASVPVFRAKLAEMEADAARRKRVREAKRKARPLRSVTPIREDIPHHATPDRVD